jgi:hypothetical protein
MKWSNQLILNENILYCFKGISKMNFQDKFAEQTMKLLNEIRETLNRTKPKTEDANIDEAMENIKSLFVKRRLYGDNS